MPRVIDCADDGVITLAECTESLLDSGFDPRDEESLLHAARQLGRLGNDPDFLADLILAELAEKHRAEPAEQSYGPQVIMLSRPGNGDFFLRANIWPSASEHMMRASGAAAFVYGLPHDHNFDFLTLGYFGPGYWGDYYEYDYEAVTGWRGEPVDLHFVERSRLEQGKLMHYRAHRDVHRQLPADSLSVSLNVMHAGGAQGWLDQYRFDLESNTVAGSLGQGASEAYLRIAVGLGSEEALDLAERFGRSHPSDRMRLAAWDALASAADDADQVWRRAEMCGSKLVAAEALLRRA
jgi:hypothetical protein